MTHNTTVHDVNERPDILLKDILLCRMLVIATGKSNSTNELTNQYAIPLRSMEKRETAPTESERLA
jgi:hypothetical protein